MTWINLVYYNNKQNPVGVTKENPVAKYDSIIAH